MKKCCNIKMKLIEQGEGTKTLWCENCGTLLLIDGSEKEILKPKKHKQYIYRINRFCDCPRTLSRCCD